jgi:hypothetical protein
MAVSFIGGDGAVACFFGLTMSTFTCRRPIIGQYVTITKEYDFNVQLKHVLEIKVHGFIITLIFLINWGFQKYSK